MTNCNGIEFYRKVNVKYKVEWSKSLYEEYV